MEIARSVRCNLLNFHDKKKTEQHKSDTIVTFATQQRAGQSKLSILFENWRYRLYACSALSFTTFGWSVCTADDFLGVVQTGGNG